MPVTRRTVLAASGTSAILAGCLGDEDDGAGPGEADAGGEPDDGQPTDENESSDGGESAEDGDSADATVRVRSHDAYGDILVGTDGLTLYNFDPDEQGAGASSCYDDCAENWPPLTVADEPTAGDGVEAELTTFEREDGETQLAADGWPLYYFAADAEPGDAEGQGINDVWWALDPAGNPIRETADGGGDESDGNDGGSSDEDDGDTGY